MDKITANDKQVGGSHYKSTTPGIPEHWDVAVALEWDYFIGAATKYLWRLGKKNPTTRGVLEDLEKSIHYLEKKRELLQAQLNTELMKEQMHTQKSEILQPQKPHMPAFSNPLDDSQ